ncbi:MAG TPA: rRNA maturation RNase YbeY [Gammaproteobacteria bacterium]|nr:rRNA maturation RNase YbeY [Gammaproteobacteria bacterium]
MTLRLHLQHATSLKPLPSRPQFRRWILAALAGAKKFPLESPRELTIRLVDEAESAELNSTYRHKKGPTNVLSFVFDSPSEVNIPIYLGDLVICAPLVLTEAEQQQKPILAHFAHLTIHGVLHLLGYDHETEQDANVMENLETTILGQLKIADPYA